ncbi:HNH endonuclease signature motif containing protein, partial [Sinomonas albida]|uniref:HNH endonuclease signature motif containing protein n=1 Tax=Sinomonas albida TaxID=369942 RepID=UPI0010A81602
GLAAANRLDTLARAQRRTDPEEARTLPQLRADALANLILTPPAPTPTAAPVVAEAPEPSAEIVVHIPAATLLGAGEEPATLEGYGPIDAGTARALAAAAPTWQRLFTGTDGVPLALGRTAYRPPKGLRRYIEYRDGTCQFPGCARPARTAELDHLIEWQDGGTTDAQNLHALCTKHHALKSLRLWNPARLPAGPDDAIADTLWISPLGTRTVTGPTGHQLHPPPSDPQPLEPPAVELPPPHRGAPPEIRVGGSHAASPQCASRDSSPPPDPGHPVGSPPPEPGPRDTSGDRSGDTPLDSRSPESDPTAHGCEAGQMPSEIESPPF